jgi:hypothetical protein
MRDDPLAAAAARPAAGADVRLAMLRWEELGSPLPDIVAVAIARWWGDRFERAPNLRALGHGQEFNRADASEECLTFSSSTDHTLTALWEYLEDKR